ncbi:MAG: hypothetical protein M3203_04620 [Actinomycetota bacterium]|nr:hypothetical protein [Actinomycetota bacterium]
MFRARRRVALSVAVVIVVGLTGPTSAAEPGHADLPSFTNSPRSGSPGTAITAWGTGCTGAETGQISLDRVGGEASVAVGTIQVGSGGEWVASLRVPADAPGGEYVIGAICTFEQGTPNLYRGNAFTVVPALAGDVRRLSVAPTSVPLGGSATVRGAGCTPPGFAIAAVTQNGSELEGAQVGRPNASGDWTVTFVFKAGYVDPNATVAVTARCFEGADRVRFTYDDRVVDVLPASPPGRSIRAPGRRGDGSSAVAQSDDGDASVPEASAGTIGVLSESRAASEAPGTGLPWVLIGLVLAGALALGAVTILRRRRAH